MPHQYQYPFNQKQHKKSLNKILKPWETNNLQKSKTQTSENIPRNPIEKISFKGIIRKNCQTLQNKENKNIQNIPLKSSIIYHNNSSLLKTQENSKARSFLKANKNISGNNSLLKSKKISSNQSFRDIVSSQSSAKVMNTSRQSNKFSSLLSSEKYSTSNHKRIKNDQKSSKKLEISKKLDYEQQSKATTTPSLSDKCRQIRDKRYHTENDYQINSLQRLKSRLISFSPNKLIKKSANERPSETLELSIEMQRHSSQPITEELVNTSIATSFENQESLTMQPAFY